MIRLVFGTNDALRSQLIRRATRSHWSHVWVEYSSSVWGGMWAAHATDHGVVKEPAERVREEYPLNAHFTCDFNPINGLTWARNAIGAPYDYGVIWNALLLVLWRLTKWEFLYKMVARNASKYSCSEFAAGILKESGVYDGDPELTTPGHLWSFCNKSDMFISFKARSESLSAPPHQ